MVATVDTRHPDYAEHILQWQMMRTTAEGPESVKMLGVRYLPMPEGFTAHADGGSAMYMAYITRAQFPDILPPTLSGLVGIIHRNEAQIEMPESMEPLWERCSKDGKTLEEFHQQITAEILLMGRYGVLVDAATEEDGGSDLPFLAGYRTEDIINWSPDGDFFVLDESGLVRDGFEWKREERYRLLELRDGVYQQRRYLRTEEDGDWIRPVARGRVPMERVPFVIAGTRDLTTEVDIPPLAGVARSSLAIYRLDADYRFQLFMTGQETLFLTGIDDKGQLPEYVGASVIHGLPLGADAKYVGPSGTGIAAHRTAIMDERESAVASGARLIDTAVKKEAESGEALRLRQSAQMASATTIARASGKALEAALRNVAVMIGVDPEEVIVTPNLKFAESRLGPAEVAQLVTGWQAGAFSYETLYENLQKGEIASPERTAEEEQQLIQEEMPDDPAATGAIAEEGDVGDGETGDVSDEELADLFDPALLEDA